MENPLQRIRMPWGATAGRMEHNLVHIGLGFGRWRKRRRGSRRSRWSRLTVEGTEDVRGATATGAAVLFVALLVASAICEVFEILHHYAPL